MSFDINTGTRGARGKILGMEALVLNTLGRKTGTQRQHPVGCFSDGHDGWPIVAPAGGASKNPAWCNNLAAHSDSVHSEMAGRTIPVVAEQLRGAARDQEWHRIVKSKQPFATYEENTDHLLPVIRLRARAAARPDED